MFKVWKLALVYYTGNMDSEKINGKKQYERSEKIYREKCGFYDY